MTRNTSRSAATLFTTQDLSSLGWPEYLRRHLRAAGLIPNDLAKETGIDLSLITKWLRGIGLPTTSTLRLVCRALKLDIRQSLVAIGAFTPHELGLEDSEAVVPDVRLIPSDALAAENSRRLSVSDDFFDRKLPAPPAPVEPATLPARFREQDGRPTTTLFRYAGQPDDEA